MRQALLRFVDTRNVVARNPPERQIGTAEMLEPFPAIAEQLGVRRAIHVRFQRVDRLPDREIEQNAIVVIRPKIRRIPRVGLQPPHKSRTVVCERVDLIQPRDKSGHDRIIERRVHPRDVDLCDVVIRHLRFLPHS